MKHPPGSGGPAALLEMLLSSLVLVKEGPCGISITDCPELSRALGWGGMEGSSVGPQDFRAEHPHNLGELG